MRDVRCRKSRTVLPQQDVCMESFRARENEALSPRRGNGTQFESWDCNHLLRTKLLISPTSRSLLLPLHILRPFFLPSLFYFRACGGVGKLLPSSGCYLKTFWKMLPPLLLAPEQLLFLSLKQGGGCSPCHTGLWPLKALGSMPQHMLASGHTQLGSVSLSTVTLTRCHLSSSVGLCP